MAVTLTVSEIRQALMHAGGRTGDGAASCAAIGTLFHQVLGELLRGDSPCNLEASLRDLDADLAEWKTHLKRQAYDQLLGPLLTRQAAALQSQGEKVLHLWTAVQAACDFLADVWWDITNQGRKPVDQSQWLSAEQQILCEVRRPQWREPVAILGQPDAVLRVPKNNHWCVLEWKLGRAAPDVDLGQACLYHLILSRTSETNGRSALAVINFRPELDERPFTAEQLAGVQEKLLDLIGRLAGVASERTIAKTETSRLTPAPAEMPAKNPPWTAELRETLLKVLREFGAPCREIKPPVVGPAFARFFVTPERGVAARKVLNQADQLHLRLKLESPPNMDILDGAVAIDLPRPDRELIPFSKLEAHFQESDAAGGCSRVPIGVDFNGRWQFCDLSASESAHLLVVGTPGSGKSQWLRVAVSSLLRTNSPATLQLLLIDPKQNAFQFAHGSSYLRRPIVVPGDDESTTEILGGLIDEMDRRYALFSQANAQSLMSYRHQTGETLPRIVCVCDEYADLLLHAETTESNAARKEIEKAFQRLAGKGRAAGVHLILATQYPSRKIITSAIQASIGAKVALRVSSALESRVALARAGAERLLGNGDLLYQCIGDPVRLQGAWLPESEECLVGAANRE